VTLAKLAARLQPLRYLSRAIIFNQGDVGDALYLVASGSVAVCATESASGAERQINILNAGEPFGEMAMLTNDPRTATIRVEQDCEVLRLDRAAFMELVREQPSVALAIASTLSGASPACSTPWLLPARRGTLTTFPR
jgi:CRP-like cAMP-binding protein